MEAWEVSLGTYMHETKIGEVRIRRSLLSTPVADVFLYKQITRWAAEDVTNEEYCYVYELGTKNSC